MDRTTRWALLLILLAVGCGSDTKAPTAVANSSSAPAPTTTSPALNPRLLHPNAVLTPGATITDITADKVCADGYAQSVAAVPLALGDQVFSAYGLGDADRAEFELDHLIPVELGGSNDITNLWPEPMLEAGKNGAIDKNAIETQLHDAVCAHHLKLDAAQAAVLHWDTVNFRLLVTTTMTAPRTTVAPDQPATTQPAAPATTKPAAPATTKPAGPPTTAKDN
jgi:hypothetical protein